MLIQWIAGRDLYAFMEEEEKVCQRLKREMGLMNQEVNDDNCHAGTHPARLRFFEAR